MATSNPENHGDIFDEMVALSKTMRFKVRGAGRWPGLFLSSPEA